ncbi:reverse transcriptase domain-containing protein [Tanacetum coccineum]
MGPSRYVLWKPSRDFTRPLGSPSGLKSWLHMLNATEIPTKHKYKLLDEEKNFKPEETLRTFIEESRRKQKQNESLFWKIKKNYDKVFKKQASSIKTIEGHLGQITKKIHGRGRLSINIPFIEALEQMPKYAKFMKDLLTQKGRGQGGINKALTNLGASISLMPYSMFLRLNHGELKPTRMCIELADKSTQIPRGIAENVIVKIGRLVFLVDFVVLDMKEDHKIPIILGRPFLATAHAMIDVFNQKISFEVRDEPITFDIEKTLRFPPSDADTCHSVDIIDLSILNHISENLEHESEGYIKPTLFAANLCKDEKPTTKLKDLPPHLEYAFLGNNLEFPAIISLLLSAQENELLLGVLAKQKSALAWKLLDAGLIYAISDSPWVSPIHVVPKKGGVTVVTNEDNKPVSTCTVNGWRVCIDYKKLNDATRKDHFPLPFIDQMLERFSGNEYYYFLDGFSGYFQIPLAPEDRKKLHSLVLMGHLLIE